MVARRVGASLAYGKRCRYPNPEVRLLRHRNGRGHVNLWPMAKAAKKKSSAPATRASQATRAKRPTVKRTALGPIGRLEDFIPYKLSVVANRVSQSIGRLFETQFNIQMPEWRIMMALYAYDDLVFNEVVDRTSMDKARVSRAQRRLVDLGLINSVNDPTDGRKVILSLTRKGEKMCGDILPEAAQREAWYLAALDDQEHHQLDVILDKLMMRSQEA
jgi:DNA-binding MarR family transcriptional regulator